MIIKSPINYTGNKYKLLPILLDLFPKNISTFIDVFTGSGTVALSVSANSIIANDKVEEVIGILNWLNSKSYSEILKEISIVINTYSLNSSNVEGYLKLREDYNLTKNDYCKLFCLICHSFNNQIRFNNKGEFNLPFGQRQFNSSIQGNLQLTSEALKHKKIEFVTIDYKDLVRQTIPELDKSSFLYFDPPYLITDATYNKYWNEEEEKTLYAILDWIDSLGLKFGLSNVITHKDKKNAILSDWVRSKPNYKVHYLNHSYSNCNYQTSGKSQEVYITNYLN